MSTNVNCSTNLPKDEFQQLHPLKNQWMLWYQPFNDFKSLQKVVQVKSIEEFWSVFNNLRQLENMEDKTTLYFFKEGIEPAWEDEQNKGRLKGNLIRNRDCNVVYQQVLMHCIGEAYPSMDQINGVAICVRKNKAFRLDVWLKSEGGLNQIETKLDETLNSMDINDHTFNWDDFSHQ
eukprot:NODE_158_length_16653_cov_0.456929.p10 type:complete len:177 gc:universal NODE_158_length_16653_cov_0.456929:11252-10722(-)